MSRGAEQTVLLTGAGEQKGSPSAAATSLHPLGMARVQHTTTGVEGKMYKLEPLCVAGGDVRWGCSGRQLGGSSGRWTSEYQKRCFPSSFEAFSHVKPV